MRQKLAITLLLSLLVFASFGQILKPAKIVAVPPDKPLKVGEEVDLVFRATIDKNWYIYTVGFDTLCGPLPTTIDFEPHPSFSLIGELRAPGDKKKYDEIFGCDVRIYENTGEFRQRIKILSPDLRVVGEYEGQVCAEQCVLFEGTFDFGPLQVSGKAAAPVTQETPVKQPNNDTPKTAGTTPAINVPATTGAVTADSVKAATIKENTGPVLDPSLAGESTTTQSFWTFFILSFLAGLAALLTPCVFPMIPMTVSYFTAPGRTRFHALIYGLSIVVIYSITGAALAPLMGPETANHLSTEWLPNLIFFLVFIVFGLSFLGLFEITLPGTFITKVDRQADRGGLLGVFFMAFTLVLVSFSCTGPLVGSILVTSAGGAFLKPIIGMLGFSLAFAIPFTLFAFFPGWLNSLPKSGGWLNSVKVVLGFIEIALAFKFLSIADQAFHWRILDREINIAIWIVVSLLTGAYLMKFFLLPGDTGKDAGEKRVSVLRVVLAMGFFTFAVYLVPGMYGAPLKALAGYLPPLYTHDFNLAAAAPGSSEKNLCDDPLYNDFLHLPHGLSGYFDYDQALACARQQNKPLFIDFTGHGCTNCREMEAVVWSDPEVLKRLQEEFVVVALYVDDKTVLPESQWYTAKDGKVKKTIGKQNADLQITNLNNNAQPFYVLVGPDERVLVQPYGYDRSPVKFVRFLDEGLRRFRERF